MFWLGVLVGLLIGSPVFCFLLALLTSSKKADEQMEEYERMNKNVASE